MSETQPESELPAPTIRDEFRQIKPADSHNESKITMIKESFSALLSMIEELCPAGVRRTRCASDLETAQMYAVKSLFDTPKE
jgi:hypothetical protein